MIAQDNRNRMIDCQAPNQSASWSVRQIAKPLQSRFAAASWPHTPVRVLLFLTIVGHGCAVMPPVADGFDPAVATQHLVHLRSAVIRDIARFQRVEGDAGNTEMQSGLIGLALSLGFQAAVGSANQKNADAASDAEALLRDSAPGVTFSADISSTLDHSFRHSSWLELGKNERVRRPQPVIGFDTRTAPIVTATTDLEFSRDAGILIATTHLVYTPKGDVEPSYERSFRCVSEVPGTTGGALSVRLAGWIANDAEEYKEALRICSQEIPSMISREFLRPETEDHFPTGEPGSLRFRAAGFEPIRVELLDQRDSRFVARLPDLSLLSGPSSAVRK